MWLRLLGTVLRALIPEKQPTRAGLIIILAPINRGLAFFAALVRVMESTVGITVTLNNSDALRLLGDASYLKSFGNSQLQTLARLSLSAHGSGCTALFFLLGVGSAAFAYLWLRSGYIPKALAALGLFGSLLMALTTLSTVVFPELGERRATGQVS